MTSPDFAAAKQHVFDRNQVQTTKAQTLAEAPRLLPVFTPLRRLPSSLNYLGQQGANIWKIIRGREGTRPEFRVGQVDAELLDEELLGLLKAQVGDGLKYLGVCLNASQIPADGGN